MILLFNYVIFLFVCLGGVDMMFCLVLTRFFCLCFFFTICSSDQESERGKNDLNDFGHGIDVW